MFAMFANVDFSAELPQPEHKADAPVLPPARKRRRIEQPVSPPPPPEGVPPARKRGRVEQRASPPLPPDDEDARMRQQREWDEQAANAEALRQGDMEREAAAGPMPPQYQTLPQVDHDIDWKLLHEEDNARADQFIQEKKWDAATFVDEDWCMACHLTATTNKFGVNENDPYNNLCIYTDKNYGKVGMKVLISTVQEMYLGQLSECTKQKPDFKFWFRKQIYDHIHTHHRTIRVHNELTLSMNNAIIQHLYKTLIKTDPVTGEHRIDYKAAELILKYEAQNVKTLKELEPMRSKMMF